MHEAPITAVNLPLSTAIRTDGVLSPQQEDTLKYRNRAEQKAEDLLNNIIGGRDLTVVMGYVTTEPKAVNEVVPDFSILFNTEATGTLTSAVPAVLSHDTIVTEGETRLHNGLYHQLSTENHSFQGLKINQIGDEYVTKLSSLLIDKYGVNYTAEDVIRALDKLFTKVSGDSDLAEKARTQLKAVLEATKAKLKHRFATVSIENKTAPVERLELLKPGNRAVRIELTHFCLTEGFQVDNSEAQRSKFVAKFLAEFDGYQPGVLRHYLAILYKELSVLPSDMGVVKQSIDLLNTAILRQQVDNKNWKHQSDSSKLGVVFSKYRFYRDFQREVAEALKNKQKATEVEKQKALLEKTAVSAEIRKPVLSRKMLWGGVVFLLVGACGLVEAFNPGALTQARANFNDNNENSSSTSMVSELFADLLAAEKHIEHILSDEYVPALVNDPYKEMRAAAASPIVPEASVTRSEGMQELHQLSQDLALASLRDQVTGGSPERQRLVDYVRWTINMSYNRPGDFARLVSITGVSWNPEKLETYLRIATRIEKYLPDLHQQVITGQSDILGAVQANMDEFPEGFDARAVEHDNTTPDASISGEIDTELLDKLQTLTKIAG
ncbi:MAG TPA: hypothetical protein VD999_04205 [Vitreimonas sp.]|nr:hypothetical protein [Vitreimonas sp.]